MEEPAACGFRKTESCRQGNVEGRRNLAILAAGDPVDPRLVGSTGAASSLGDIEADAGRSPQRLISQAALRDGGFAHSVEQLARLLVGTKLFKGQISKVRHRRLLSKSGAGAGDDERRESREAVAPKAQAFSFPNAGVSDDAAGVGTRLLPVPLPFPAFRLSDQLCRQSWLK
jgi:hypothetical protein